MSKTHGLAFVNYRYFRTSPETRKKYARAYYYVSKRRRVLDLVGKGGCLWLATSFLDPQKQRVYSLAYKLVDCTPFDVWEHLRKDFGEFGVIGDPRQSRHYPRNDLTDILLDLDFSPSKPIKDRSVIGMSLMNARQLAATDVEKLESFEDKLLHGRHVFISYSTQDREQADLLQECLESRGHRVWRDVRSIVGGQQWEPAIRRAIENADAFIAILSERSARSKWVEEEIDVAEGLLGRPGKLKRLVPFCLSEEAWQQFPGLHSYQRIDARKLEEAARMVSDQLAELEVGF